jgi:hypothetical protein
MATEGPISTQEMGEFSGDWSGDEQLWWRPTKAGSRITLRLNAPETRTYELLGYFTTARDYGNVRLLLNGKEVGAFKGYTQEVRPSGPVAFGRQSLQSGANELVVEVTGKEAASTGYLVGIDGFVLKP